MSQAIDRYQDQTVDVNEAAVYAVYTSGTYHRFFASEEEAIAHCAKPESGAELNGQWIQDQYTSFPPGSLFAVAGNEAVYISSDQSATPGAVMARWQIPFAWDA